MLRGGGQGNIRTVRDGRVEPVPAATEAWERGLPHLVRRQPTPAVALVYSLPDLALREARVTVVPWPACFARSATSPCWTTTWSACARRVAPARHRSSDVLERRRAFAEAGGLVVAAGTPPIPLANTDETGGLFGGVSQI